MHAQVSSFVSNKFESSWTCPLHWLVTTIRSDSFSAVSIPLHSKHVMKRQMQNTVQANMSLKLIAKLLKLDCNLMSTRWWIRWQKGNFNYRGFKSLSRLQQTCPVAQPLKHFLSEIGFSARNSLQNAMQKPSWRPVATSTLHMPLSARLLSSLTGKDLLALAASLAQVSITYHGTVHFETHWRPSAAQKEIIFICSMNQARHFVDEKHVLWHTREIRKKRCQVHLVWRHETKALITSFPTLWSNTRFRVRDIFAHLHRPWKTSRSVSRYGLRKLHNAVNCRHVWVKVTCPNEPEHSKDFWVKACVPFTRICEDRFHVWVHVVS